MDKKEIIKSLLKNKDIAKFVKDNNLTDDEVIASFSKLSLYIENSNICANCDGHECNSAAEGMKSYLEVDNYGHVRVVYEDCPLYQYNDVSNLEVIDYTDSNIQIELNKARMDLLKRLDEFRTNYQSGKFTKGLYLYGRYGIGKSLIIYSYAKKLVGNGAKVLFAYYPDLVRRIQSLFGTGELEALVLKLKKADILILDDIGREANTPYIRDEILGPILQYRCDNNLPMFMTSNRAFNELQKHLSETNSDKDDYKASAMMSRIKYLMEEYYLDDKDYRN